MIAILFLFLSAAAQKAPTPKACRILSGSWQNELGSTMKLSLSSSGALSGYYKTAVGSAPPGLYQLAGRYDSCDGSTAPTLAFAVSWSDSTANASAHSATAWSGVYVDGAIYTTWLLTVAVNSSADVWAATRVGTNVFQQTN